MVDLAVRLMKRGAAALGSIGVAIDLAVGLPFIMMTQVSLENERYVHNHSASTLVFQAHFRHPRRKEPIRNFGVYVNASTNALET